MAKKAFLVGINRYKDQDAQQVGLKGCVRDVMDMANTLVICGFPVHNIRICTDIRATKKNILLGLKRLFSGASQRDSLFFYLSCLGSQMVNLDLDTQMHADSQFEVLCPYDVDFQEKTFIEEKDFLDILSKLENGCKLEVVTDCCHVGLGDIEKEALAASGEAEKVKIRHLAPPFDFYFYFDFQPGIRKLRFLKREKYDKRVPLPKGIRLSVWSSCLSNQVSNETFIDNVPRGVFTYHFCKVIRKTQGAIKRDRLLQIVSAAIKREGFAQIPCLKTRSKGNFI